MAKRVGYFQDFNTPEEAAEAFSEGPFVMVNANGWRVEVELPGHICPVLPDPSVYELRKRLGWPAGKTYDEDKAARVVDQLNQMVRDGKIILDKVWRVA